MTFWISTVGWWNGGVDAEHDPLVAHGLIGVGDLAAHGRAGGLQPDIFHISWPW